MTKIKLEIEKGISITLSDDQLKEIDSQRQLKSKYNHYTDIKTVRDACDYLKIKEIPRDAYNSLKVVAKAINQLINDERFPDFKNNNQKKHYPYFNTASPGLVFYVSYCYFSYSAQVAFTKSKESSDYLGTQFIHLYQQLSEEYY